jgi:hypothetical protein
MVHASRRRYGTVSSLTSLPFFNRAKGESDKQNVAYVSLQADPALRRRNWTRSYSIRPSMQAAQHQTIVEQETTHAAKQLSAIFRGFVKSEITP